MSKRKRKRNRSSQPQVKVTLWHAIRDIVIASLNKGQFLVAVVAGIVIIIIVRMPRDKIGELANRLYDDIISMRVVGWILAATLLGGWWRHVKWQRQVFAKELDRMAKERNELQRRLNNGEGFESSD